jgi:hypothetical protein
MDGKCGCGCCPRCEQKSNALGGLIPSKAELKKNRARRQARKDKRLNIKQTQAQAQKIASENIGKESATDIALAQSLTNQKPDTSSGMSKGTKTALIVGGVILVGVLGYFAYKKFSKKGKGK